jgi:hypothetical protein
MPLEPTAVLRLLEIGGFMSSEPTADLRPLGPKVFVRRTPCTARLSKSKRYPPVLTPGREYGVVLSNRLWCNNNRATGQSASFLTNGEKSSLLQALRGL